MTEQDKIEACFYVGKFFKVVRIFRLIDFPYRFSLWSMTVCIFVYFPMMSAGAPPVYMSEIGFDHYFYTMIVLALVSAIMSLLQDLGSIDRFAALGDGNAPSISFGTGSSLMWTVIFHVLCTISVFCVGAIGIDFLYQYDLSVLESLATGSEYLNIFKEFFAMDHNNTPKMIFFCLSMFIFLFLIRLLRILRMVKLNSWAIDERCKHPDSFGGEKMVEGSNLLKVGAVVEVFFFPLGYILSIIGYKIAAKGFREYNRSLDDAIVSTAKIIDSPTKIKINSDDLKKCPSCGFKVRLDPGETFCWNCGAPL